MMQQETKNRTASALPPTLVLLKLVTDAWPARSIHVAARFGIADQLKDGPMHIAALAEATGTHASSLCRLLRALTQIGIFAEVEPECFANTDLSTHLRSDLPGSMYAMARMVGADYHWQS